MNKLVNGIIALILMPSMIKAQDPHFSQYYSSPLTLNPSMTGYTDGDSRFAANYRQQWWSLGSPYTTGTVSYDSKILQKKLDKDVLGFGVLALFDESSGGGFKNVNFAASLAYHKSLNEQSKIGAGFQLVYASRFINSEKLNFASQFNGSGFDTNIPSTESFGSLQRDYFDINTGIQYSYQSDKVDAYAGASLYHIGRPNISFLKNEMYRLPQRFTAHFGSRITVGENSNKLFFSGIYMQQAGANETNLGVAYGINASDKAIVYGGLWYRIKDAIIPYIGLGYNNFDLGVSYDILNSELKNYKSGNGSCEISVRITGKKTVNVYTNYKKGRVF